MRTGLQHAAAEMQTSSSEGSNALAPWTASRLSQLKLDLPLRPFLNLPSKARQIQMTFDVRQQPKKSHAHGPSLDSIVGTQALLAPTADNE